MSELVVCPVKAETAGTPDYLRWAQFCQSGCPFTHNKYFCDNRESDEHFPVDSRRIDASRTSEVLSAWVKYKENPPSHESAVARGY